MYFLKFLLLKWGSIQYNSLIAVHERNYWQLKSQQITFWQWNLKPFLLQITLTLLVGSFISQIAFKFFGLLPLFMQRVSCVVDFDKLHVANIWKLHLMREDLVLVSWTKNFKNAIFFMVTLNKPWNRLSA